MKREFEAVQHMLVKGQTQVKLNQTWKKIHQQQGVGIVTSTMLSLSRKEREYLRNWIMRETGIDPYSRDKLPERRIKVAEIGRNEKLARRNVFSSMLRVARYNGGDINTRSGKASIPPSSVLEISSDQLILSDETVVIVENGELIREWHKLFLPSELEHALIIYRGHESEAALLRDLLISSPPKLNIGYYDFDPAGLLMGLSNGHQAVLLPRKLGELSRGKALFDSINQPDKFWDQGEQLRILQKKDASCLQPYIDHVVSHQVALMQEHMMVHQIPLTVYHLAN